jgi:hypothetical protein
MFYDGVANTQAARDYVTGFGTVLGDLDLDVPSPATRCPSAAEMIHE